MAGSKQGTFVLDAKARTRCFEELERYALARRGPQHLRVLESR
jgi:hypothetical protein